MPKINILAICPSPNDPTSFYRGFGPLLRLEKDYDDIRLELDPHIDWRAAVKNDIFFIQRPCTPDHFKVARFAKTAGKSLWVDFDDDLFSVLADNPTFKYYQSEERKTAVRKICELADVVTVTTDYLAQKMRKLNKNIIVIPNALDENLFHKRNHPSRKPNKIINWRGSKTHTRDLFTMAVEMIEISKKHPDWTWNFIGDLPWFIIEKMPKGCVQVSESIDIINYFQFIKDLDPAIHIVPLADTDFNKSKSNIAWLEGIYSGAAVVAPSWPQWQVPGVWTYTTSGGFGKQVENLITQFDSGKGEVVASQVNEAWDFIKMNYTLQTTNLQRYQLINNLAESKKMVPFIDQNKSNQESFNE